MYFEICWNIQYQSLKYSMILIQVVEIFSEESKNSDADFFEDHVRIQGRRKVWNFFFLGGLVVLGGDNVSPWSR